ncbi:MAG: hypothetical protein AAFV87_14405 [Pseudomonadota bacterium]
MVAPQALLRGGNSAGSRNESPGAGLMLNRISANAFLVVTGMEELKRMPTIRVSMLLLAAGFLSACGGGDGDGLKAELTRSAIVPTGSGSVSPGLGSTEELRSISSTSGLVQFATGLDGDRGQAVAAAGVVSSNVGPAVTTGTATYSTQYQYTVLDEVERSSTSIDGRRATIPQRNIQLRADFDAGTLDGSTSDLTIDAQIAGQNISGRAEVDYFFVGVGGEPPVSGSIAGDIAGRIGSTGVVGAIAGHDSNTVVAGGFVGTRN